MLARGFDAQEAAPYCDGRASVEAIVQLIAADAASDGAGIRGAADECSRRGRSDSRPASPSSPHTLRPSRGGGSADTFAPGARPRPSASEPGGPAKGGGRTTSVCIVS